TLVAAAILSATVIYSDAIRDLGLRHAVNVTPARLLDVHLTQSANVTESAYASSNARKDAAVQAALGPVFGPSTRQGTSATFFPTAPGEPVDEGNRDRPRSNLFFRTDLTDHIEVV